MVMVVVVVVVVMVVMVVMAKVAWGGLTSWGRGEEGKAETGNGRAG